MVELLERLKVGSVGRSTFSDIEQSYIYPGVIGNYILLFKSLRNSIRRNKGNFTSKSNSNKIKFCGGEGQHYLVLNKI